MALDLFNSKPMFSTITLKVASWKPKGKILFTDTFCLPWALVKNWISGNIFPPWKQLAISCITHQFAMFFIKESAMLFILEYSQEEHFFNACC